jgi:hypothetical protein
MILSDLPTPAEALVHATRMVLELRAGGKPLHIPDQVRAGFFEIML